MTAVGLIFLALVLVLYFIIDDADRGKRVERSSCRHRLIGYRAGDQWWCDDIDGERDGDSIGTAFDAEAARVGQAAEEKVGDGGRGVDAGSVAQAIQQGLEASERGNVAQATRLLGRAVQLAHESGNADMTSRLKRVVDIDDAANGTVRVKRSVEKAASMDLELESTTTKRAVRREPV